jgi:hypothetical protein
VLAVQCMVSSAWCIVCILQYTAHCTLHTAHYTLYAIYYTLYTIYYTFVERARFNTIRTPPCACPPHSMLYTLLHTSPPTPHLRGLAQNKLTGLIPPLPFVQYSDFCALTDEDNRPGNCTTPNCNHFKCPLPGTLKGVTTCGVYCE